MQQQRIQQYNSVEDASPRAKRPAPVPIVKQRSDGKPERQAAKRFKTSLQLHGAALLRSHSVLMHAIFQSRYIAWDPEGASIVCSCFIEGSARGLWKTDAVSMTTFCGT
jgi:hypothetical protein